MNLLVCRKFFAAGDKAYRESLDPLADDACLDAWTKDNPEPYLYVGNYEELMSFVRGWDWAAEQASLDKYAAEQKPAAPSGEQQWYKTGRLHLEGNV
jgi:hypothetical protein